jgi:hypothetical protein
MCLRGCCHDPDRIVLHVSPYYAVDVHVVSVYSSEVFLTSVRAFASGFLMSVGKIGGAVAPFVAQAMLRMKMAREVLIIFSVVTASGILFVFTTILEKAGGAGHGRSRR